VNAGKLISRKAMIQEPGAKSAAGLSSEEVLAIYFLKIAFLRKKLERGRAGGRN
jgi:hypothetical protein